ncbi:TonB-dependent receptor [Sphingobium sufflavum]|uniref:TonB-dependent receptor n=1 Tax=Sphingobium sufflavum TaxID=1129547 RepID=UPI001F1CD5D2|nr:TonB-dependent receptor [Sphingobium sufflavum]MCE7798733.1 TonB-dependent receptor [Sphingobium sufflavum]
MVGGNIQYSQSRGIKRGLVIGLLLAGAALPVAAFAADAATAAADDADDAGRNDIVVNGHQEKKATPVTLSVQPTAGIAAVYELNQSDIAGLAITTPNDLLRAIPGVQVADLGNGGIPNGVTIRGWGLVSDGTSVRGVVDGFTRNFSSGPNGNGSDDLNVLIPETIGSVNVIKGPFDTRYSGNFAYAGTAIFTTADTVPNRASVSYGSFDRKRLLVTLGNGQDANQDTKYYAALEGLSERGRRDNNTQDKISFLAKLTKEISPKDVLKVTGQLYTNVFGQPGYIRSDLVERGFISENSATSNDAKGYRRSGTVTAEWQHRDDVFNFDANGWVERVSQYRSINRQDLAVSEIFPTNAFRDKRWSVGLGFNPWVNFKVAGIDAILRAGVELRGDFIDTKRYPVFHNQAVAQPTILNAWTGFFNYSNGKIWNPDVYAELSLKPADWIKVTAGVRNDWFHYDATTTYYPSTATGLVSPFSQTQPVGVAVPLRTVDYSRGTSTPTLHGGIAISPGAGFTLLANFGEGITSQSINIAGFYTSALSALPTLKPTKLNTKEIVLKYDNEELGINLQGGVYHTLNQGELAADPLGSGNQVNLGKSIRKGIDIDGRVRLYDRDGTSVRIGANYNYLDARLTGGTNSGSGYITGTPPWTAGWNLDAATPVGAEGEKLRLSVQHNFVAGTYLSSGNVTLWDGTTGILKNGDYNRLAAKLTYEKPESHNLRVWVSSIFYNGDRFAEMATTQVGFFTNDYTVRTRTYRVGNSQAPFRAEIGASIDF